MRFIIDFADNTAQSVIDAYFTDNGCTVVSTYDALGQIFLVEAEQAPDAADYLTVVEDNEDNGLKLLSEDVVFLNDTGTVDHATTDDDNWWKIAVIPDVDLESETFTTMKVSGTRVYLLDSGIDVSHPEFAGKDVSLLFSVKDGDFTDTSGHGTALASVIMGAECGLTDASLKVVKIFHAGQATLISDLLSCLNAVVADYSANPGDPAVMNLSWAINKNTYVEDKIRTITAMGILVSVAAGNSGVPVADVTPASMPEVLTVGSFGQELTPSDFTNYSDPNNTSLTQGETNYGPGLDLFAPGENIKVAVLGGGYGYSAGTSVSAAVFSAVLTANIARGRVSYTTMGLENATSYIRYISRTNGLLTLEGKYAASPNETPKTSLSPVTSENHMTRIWPNFSILESGTAFALKMFDAAAFERVTVTGIPDGWTIQDNWLVGSAQSEGFDSNHVVVTQINVVGETSAETISYVFTVVSFDSQEVDRGDATQAANLTFLTCCPPPSTCCGTCPKGGGGTCNELGDNTDCRLPGNPCD